MEPGRKGQVGATLYPCDKPDPQPLAATIDSVAKSDRRATDKLIPDRPDSERDEAWGDPPNTNDARLENDIPPHWS